MSAPAKKSVSARTEKKAKAKVRICCNGGEQGHFARECPAPKGKGKGKNWLPPPQWTQYNSGFIPKQWTNWQPGNSKGQGKGPDQSYGKGGVSVIGQEGLFNCLQLGCVNAKQWQHDNWNANEVDNYGEGNWPEEDRENQACATVCRSYKTVPACEEGMKVSWKMLDCQDELHKSTTHNKFATLTLGEEEQEFDEDVTSIGGNCSVALNTAAQEICAKRKVNTKNFDMLVMVRESLVGSCTKTSSDAQLAWMKVSIAIDSGACDCVISPKRVLDHEVHEPVEPWRGENFQSATREPTPNLGDQWLPLYMREGTVRGMVMKASL